MADRRIETTDKEDGAVTTLHGEWGQIAGRAAVTDIDAFTHTYYFEAGGDRVDLHVVRGPDGPYLHTDARGEGPNRLLEVPAH